MRILHQDNRIIVCIKPVGVPSTDVPGGLPQLLAPYLTDCQGKARTVHRLDQVVSGVIVLAKSKRAAQLLSQQVAEHTFEKAYLAVIQGVPQPTQGRWEDLLARDQAQRRTYITQQPGPEARKAALTYRVLEQQEGYSLVHIRLETGRTHQIRAQFSHRGFPLVGDRKYGGPEAPMEGIALWSQSIRFRHPQREELMEFTATPEPVWPWNLFDCLQFDCLQQEKGDEE